jgi:hypothetical protein
MDMHTENFFREATLRICGSLNIATAMERCFAYVKEFIPMSGMGLQIYEPDTNTARNLVSVNDGCAERIEQTIPLPKKAWHNLKKGWPELPEVTIASSESLLDPHILRLAMHFSWKEFSCIIIRLELDNERLGILSVYTQKDNQYLKKHADLLIRTEMAF